MKEYTTAKEMKAAYRARMSRTKVARAALEAAARQAAEPVKAKPDAPRRPPYGWAKEQCTLPAAQRLAKKISEFWEKHGRVVNVRLEPFRIMERGEEREIWQVRSDMINGMPRQLAVPQAA